MKNIILIALALSCAPFFSTAMEQHPAWKPTASSALRIVIPITNYKSSDDEESGGFSTERLSRTSGSPLRLTRSGSPLPRVSARNHVVSPRIEEEMQQNTGLSPKDKKLTPRSQLRFEYFGNFFDEEEKEDDFTYSTSPEARIISHSNMVVKEVTKEKNEESLERLAQLNAKKQVALMARSTSPEKTNRDLFELAIAAPADTPQPRTPIRWSYSMENLLDPTSGNQTKRIFPRFFTDNPIYVPHPKVAHANELLQVGIIKNDLTLVKQCLTKAAKPTAQLRKALLKAATAAAKKIMAHKDCSNELVELIKIKYTFIHEMQLLARPHALRMSLEDLTGSSAQIDRTTKNEYYKGKQIIGLSNILRVAHCLKAKESGNEHSYLETFGKINTALWDAFQQEFDLYLALNDLIESTADSKQGKDFKNILDEVMENA